MLRPYFKTFKCPQCRKMVFPRYRSSNNPFVELTNETKLKIESKWKSAVTKGTFDSCLTTSSSKKMYVLSMFPYPSGNLHLGHMRVYTLGDSMARYYRLNGYNVFLPIGFDAFGLPAENAAFERGIPAGEWTYANIKTMREQLKTIGCSFDWNHEVITCDPSYYKFTQYIFLLMYEAGLVYRDKASVNWDPIDKTVLANEQVDEEGRSWRSGAKVEKKLLHQWFIKTTRFAHDLRKALDDPALKDWRDIVSLQKHWLGECDGASFELPVVHNGDTVTRISVWTRYPEFIKSCTFLAVSKDSFINLTFGNGKSRLDIEIFNPFSGSKLPVIVCEGIQYDKGTDMKLVDPRVDCIDKQFAKRHGLEWSPVEEIEEDLTERQRVCEEAKSSGTGGYLVSSILKDWPISRQRKWGTPIPLVLCDNCGTVPVPKEELPVVLPQGDIKAWSQTKCPKCQGDAARETDTMDTFVDSSWYFLRYLDPKNDSLPYDQEMAHRMMPVDLYVGGKEHAVLHLYYARFFSRFLHSINLLNEPEPFKNLLVQGMVMGKTYKVKDSGKYLQESQVNICNGKAIESASGKQVEETWEKMSKSKHNGIEPTQILNKYGVDSTRLFILSDVAPTSNKYWKSESFPGILNWQKRIWALEQDFTWSRVSVKSPKEKRDYKMEEKLWDSRNFYTKGVSFNYRCSFQLSVAISKLQGFTNSLKKCPKEYMALSSEFEKSFAALIIMLGPMAPHFTSELWDNFQHLPRRVNINSHDIHWGKTLFQQSWPKIDDHYHMKLVFLVNNAIKDQVVLPYHLFRDLNLENARQLAFSSKKVKKFIGSCDILNTDLTILPDFEAYMNIEINHLQKQTEKKIEKTTV